MKALDDVISEFLMGKISVAVFQNHSNLECREGTVTSQASTGYGAGLMWLSVYGSVTSRLC